jgi:hypothetical protein
MEGSPPLRRTLDGLSADIVLFLWDMAARFGGVLELHGRGVTD